MSKLTKDDIENAKAVIAAAAEIADDLGNEALAAMDDAGEDFIEEAGKNGVDADEAEILLTVGKIIAMRRAADTLLADIEPAMAEHLREQIAAMPEHVIPLAEEDAAAEEGESDEEEIAAGTGEVEVAPEPLPVKPPPSAPMLVKPPSLGKAPRLK